MELSEDNSGKKNGKRVDFPRGRCALTCKEYRTNISELPVMEKEKLLKELKKNGQNNMASDGSGLSGQSTAEHSVASIDPDGETVDEFYDAEEVALANRPADSRSRPIGIRGLMLALLNSTNSFFHYIKNSLIPQNGISYKLTDVIVRMIMVILGKLFVVNPTEIMQ